MQSSATSISDELDLSHEDSTGDRTSELAAQLDYLRRMSRYEHLMDEQQHREGSAGELGRTTEDDPFVQLTSGVDDGDLLAGNYLSVVREEPLSSDEQEDEEQEKKKRKRKTDYDDDQPLNERRDDDDDDDDEQKGNRPSMLAGTATAQASQAETQQVSTSTTESSQRPTESSTQAEQQMEMSYDSINDFMVMSQDSLKQQSTESLDSEQELSQFPSRPTAFPTNETDEFVLNQHNTEPTPSQMIGKYDDDEDDESFQRTKSAAEHHYPLISNELEIGQLPVIHARRTASENSLYSNSSSSAPIYDNQSLSTSCLADKDDLTPSNEYTPEQKQFFYDDAQKNQETDRSSTTTDDVHVQSAPPATIGFFDRVKAFVSKPVEIVQEAMEGRRKQRSNSSTDSASDLNDQQLFENEEDSTSSQQQHFQSTDDLHDEEKSKLVRSPEFYNADNLEKQHLLPHLSSPHRTQSDSALALDEFKHLTLTTTGSHETSEEFLPTMSKDNSAEFMSQQQRHSTPYDDVMEKESSPEHSESSNLPTTAFSDAFEPTSSCQRPLALSVSAQPQASDETMTEEELDALTASYVNQVLNDVVVQLGGDHEDSSSSQKSDQLPAPGTSSDEDEDDDDDELREEDEEGERDKRQHDQIPTDTSSFGLNDRYSADESSNTREQSADEETSGRSSTTATPLKTLRRTQTDIEGLDLDQTPTALVPPIIRRSSQSDTGTYFSALSPSSGEFVDTPSQYSTVDEDKQTRPSATQSTSSQYLTANDETPNFLTSDDNEHVDPNGTVNYAYEDSSSDEPIAGRQTTAAISDRATSENYSGEGEESSGGPQVHVQRRKRSSEQRLSLPLDSTNTTNEVTSPKSVSFKLDLNDVYPRSPRLSSSGLTMPRQDSLESPTDNSNEKSIVKMLQEEILRTNLETMKQDLQLNDDSEERTYPTTTASAAMSTGKGMISYSDYDAGSESDRDSALVDSLKSTIQVELNDIYHEKESIIDKIKQKFERSLDRLIEKTLAGDETTDKSDIVSPFTDPSLNRSLGTIEQPSGIARSHSEQFLQACPDELDYGTLQRFSSDSCIMIRVPEQYTPSSTVFFDQLRADQLEKKASSKEAPSAFSYYTKQEYPQPSSSPIEMLSSTSELIENISPIHPYTPRSFDDSSLELGERDMTDMSDEFVLVKHLSTPSPSGSETAAAAAAAATSSTPDTISKEAKPDTPSNSSSNSSDKHESPDLIDILQHQCEYPPLDTGFDLRAGTTLETVYESPELRQDEIKSAISTLSLAASEPNRPVSSNTPNTDDSLMEFERIEMELLRNPSTTSIVEAAREIRSSVDSLIQQHDEHDNTQKVESFIEKHFSTMENDVQHVLNDILDQTSDLTHSISSQSDATTVIFKSQRHSSDDEFVQITHDDFQRSEQSLFSSDEDMLRNPAAPSSHGKRRLSAPTSEQAARRVKTPSSSSSSSSSFSSTSRSVIYSQQHPHSSHHSARLLQAETDLTSFKQQQQTQSATDLPFLPPFVNTTPMKSKRHASSISSTPSLVQAESTTGPTSTKKKTHSHPGSLGGSATALPPRSTLSKEGASSSPQTSISPHSSSSSSHHSDDCYCADSTSTSHPH